MDVASLELAFPFPDGATGAAIGIGRRLVALELFDHPATAGKLWGRSVEGAVRAHLDHHRLVASGAVTRAWMPTSADVGGHYGADS